MIISCDNQSTMLYHVTNLNLNEWIGQTSQQIYYQPKRCQCNTFLIDKW